MYARPVFSTLRSRLEEPRRFIQVLAGPRQTGKTTLARQTLDTFGIPSHYASADEPTVQSRVWLEQQWELGRLLAKEGGRGRTSLLVLDEVQKIPRWSETVKRLWDEDTRGRTSLKILLLGSSPLLMQAGLTESLAGRFETIPVTHWSYPEMQAAFGWTLDRYIYFGGYPGAAALVKDENRWSRYILDSIIETTLSRDILLITRIDKPALLRRLFHLACDYSGRMISYQKMLGQLQDAGNTTTLAHYLDLLSGAGLVRGISKFAGQRARQRGSSPKLQVLNNALMTAASGLTFLEARKDREFWGRLVESAVGAHIANDTLETRLELFYWRERNREVDFVLRMGKAVIALEVKSGRDKEALPGVEAFGKSFRSARSLLVGGQGIPVEKFLRTPVVQWFEGRP